MNRAPKHVFFCECMVGISMPSLKTHYSACNLGSRLPLGRMPILNRVAGTCPAGNQHFLMPFGADHAHKAGLNSLSNMCQLFTETDTVILFPFHISSA